MRNCESHTNVIAMNAALGSMGGTVDVERKWEKNVGNCYVAEGGSIPRLRLDDLKLPVCGAILLDAEGYEEEIIKGAIYTIHRCEPSLIIAETITETLQLMLHEAGYGSAQQLAPGDDFHFLRRQ